MTGAELVEAIERVNPGDGGFVVVRVHSDSTIEQRQKLAHQLQLALAGFPGRCQILILRHGIAIRSLPEIERRAVYEYLREEFEHPASAVMACIECGCTEDSACPGGCGWVYRSPNGRRGLCSTCWSRTE